MKAAPKVSYKLDVLIFETLRALFFCRDSHFQAYLCQKNSSHSILEVVRRFL
jgi:hypothetical protein